MTKRQSKYIREFKQKVAQDIQKRRREELSKVMVKKKVETFNDIIAIFNGLSKRAKDSAVLGRIYSLATFGKSPTEIIKTMEPEK